MRGTRILVFVALAGLLAAGGALWWRHWHTEVVPEPEPKRGQTVVPTDGPVASDSGLEIPRYHALIIGINDYANWQDLLHAREDAETLAAVLKDRYGFADVRLLRDKDATQKGILDAFQSLLKLGRDDDVLIFFAGHGQLNQELAEGYWIPHEATKDSPAGYVSNVTIQKYISRMKARHVLVVADACFSGSLLRGDSDKLPDSLDVAWYRQAMARPSRFVITSGDLESVPDNSVFATKLIGKLQYRQASVFAAKELALELEKEVPQFTRQSVLSGRINDPRDENGQFVFIRQGGATSSPGRATSPTEPPPVVSVSPSATEDQTMEAKVDGEAAWARVTAAGLDKDPLFSESAGKALRAVSLGREGYGKGKWDLACKSYGEAVSLCKQVETADAERKTALERKAAADAKAEAARKAAAEKAAEEERIAEAKRASEEAKKGPALDRSWTSSSCEMEFLPVSGCGVLFGKYEVTNEEYRKCKSDHDSGSSGGKSLNDARQPVVNVSWDDAKAFCVWLTEQERSAGRLPAGWSYRLPTDAEWSVAVGLNESSGGTPESKQMKTPDVYPWGTQWPPPKGAGNYNQSLGVDSFDVTAPVGSFAANKYGLCDMGGNVWEWCEDFYDGGSGPRVLRGGSWLSGVSGFLLSSCRIDDDPEVRYDDYGFRCVLAASSR